jgi:hypothetical protein
MFESDEILHWPRRLSEFHFALSQGQWWPRWFANLEWGHGYPFPNFYAPLPLWIGELCLLTTASTILATKGAFLIAGGLATWGAYRWLRPGVSRPAAVVGALLYLLAPYHTLNIFVRGNLAEYLAMGVFPWAMWALHRLGRRTSACDLALAALCVGAYQLTHTLSALFGSAVLVGLILLLWLFKQSKLTTVGRQVGALAAGTLLTAIFWLPAIHDTRFVRVGEVMHQIVAADHVVEAWQLLDPTWAFGYSRPLGMVDELSMQIGFPHVAALILGVLAIYHVPAVRAKLAPWLLICLALLLVMLPWAAPLWNSPVLGLIQFPWRLLAWVSLAVATVGAVAVASLDWTRSRLASSIVMLICLTMLWYCRAEFWREDIAADHFRPEITRAFIRGNTTAGEYLPRWRLEPPTHPSVWELTASSQRVPISPGEGGVFDRSWDVEAAEEVWLRWDVYRFPTWRVTIDGQSAEEIQAAADGTLLFLCAAGQHRVRIRWVATPVHRLATGISGLTLLSLLAACLWPMVRRRSGLAQSTVDGGESAVRRKTRGKCR